MPVYDHYCSNCDTITEVACKIRDRKQFAKCKSCGGSAERIITSNIQRVEPTWLDSAVANLADEARSQISDRNDFDRYCKREGIAQI